MDVINNTLIALVPMCTNQKSMVDFRQISICNIVYKLITKVMANRLRHILPYIIDEAQSAFVTGRGILDNVLIAFKTLHVIWHHKTKKLGHFTLKNDNDQAEWEVLDKIMAKIGFCLKWRSWFRECITSVSYRILVNGSPSKGLEQRDPLARYLFMLCSEGLNALLWRAVDEGSIRGVSIYRRSPTISHLYLRLTIYSSSKRIC